MNLFKFLKARKSSQTTEDHLNKPENDSERSELMNKVPKVNDEESLTQTHTLQTEEILSFTEYDINKIAKIKDIKILTRIAIENESFIVGLDAVRFINDESALIDVIKGSKHSFVQGAAFDKLSDEGLILLAKEAISKGNFYNIFPEVSKRVKSPQKLLEAFKEVPRDDVWDTIIRQIKDQKILAKVALKLEYLTSKGNSMLGNINEPQALAYVFENAVDTNMKDEAFRKLERIKPEIIKDVKNGRYTVAEYFKVEKENETVAENSFIRKLRYQDDSFQYSEVINGWEVIYTSDLYQEIVKFNIKEYQINCLLDGVKLKTQNRTLFDNGVNIKAKIVCPKCQKMFDFEDYVNAGMGGTILRCKNCGFNFDYHYSGENGSYYIFAYTYVGKPFDIRIVPKPSIFISKIENI